MGKAVVKFSRANQNYIVQYDEYDGGGAIPGVASAGTESAPHASKLSKPGGSAKECIRTMLSAPVHERHLEEAAAPPAPEPPKSAAPTHTASTVEATAEAVV